MSLKHGVIMDDRLRKQMEFILEVDKLKKIGRQIWIAYAPRASYRVYAGGRETAYL